ncbi:hypothetical protein ACGFK1_29275 [Mycobacterium sp. NPDC048908]|uniref:hypothetical protein n=1 Tax=Mycobacterium sp. NPDC048908 TaxID=3364292 RepID=UPI00371E1A0D
MPPINANFVRAQRESRSMRGAPLIGVRSGDRDRPGPQLLGAYMADKSPRQSMSKKSGKTLKEKRADKRAKAERSSSTTSLTGNQKH